MKDKHRKPVTLKDRMTPCLICLHPLSQKHHLLPFSTYGEFSTGTIQLCANCHDLYHLLERKMRKIRNSKDSSEKLLDVESEEDKLIERIVAFRYEYTPLMYLANAVIRFQELIRLNKDLSLYSPEENDAMVNHFTFIKGFKSYVATEREKQNERLKAMRKEGLFDGLLGSNWRNGDHG